MNSNNVISGFRATGICPFNRNAIKVPGLEEEREDADSLSEKTGLAYIPLFSPAPKCQLSRVISPPLSSSPISFCFTEEEIERFQVRWENGYDLKHYQRYNQWLEVYHPGHLKTGDLDLTNAGTPFPHFPGYSSDEAHATDPDNQSPPVSSIEATSKLSAPSILSSLLVVPEAPAKVVKKKTAARVLTSKENLELLEAKEKEKQELEEQK